MRPALKYAAASAGLLALGYFAVSHFGTSPAPQSVSHAPDPMRVQSPDPVAALPMASRDTPTPPPSTVAASKPQTERDTSPPSEQRTRSSASKSTESEADSLGLSYAEPADQASRTSEARSKDLPQAKLQASANLRPADDRWIGELSGRSAKLSMGRHRADAQQACEIIENGQCVRVPAPKDLSLVGVVVKTKRLADAPTTPLTGKVVRGNYAQYTPALYVK